MRSILIINLFLFAITALGQEVMQEDITAFIANIQKQTGKANMTVATTQSQNGTVNSTQKYSEITFKDSTLTIINYEYKNFNESKRSIEKYIVRVKDIASVFKNTSEEDWEERYGISPTFTDRNSFVQLTTSLNAEKIDFYQNNSQKSKKTSTAFIYSVKTKQLNEEFKKIIKVFLSLAE